MRSKIDRAVHSIRAAATEGTALSLAELSKEVGLSKWHLQRVFRKHQGVTPREMAEGIIRTGREGGQKQTPTYMEQPMAPILTLNPDESMSILLNAREYGGSNTLEPASAMYMDLDWLEDAQCAFLGVDGEAIMPAQLSMDELDMSVDVDVENLLSDLFPELQEGSGLL